MNLIYFAVFIFGFFTFLDFIYFLHNFSTHIILSYISLFSFLSSLFIAAPAAKTHRMHFSVKISWISFHFNPKICIFRLDASCDNNVCQLETCLTIIISCVVQRYNCFIQPREFLQPYIMFQNGSDLKTPQYISRSLFHFQDIKIFLFQENIYHIASSSPSSISFSSSPNVLCRNLIFCLWGNAANAWHWRLWNLNLD